MISHNNQVTHIMGEEDMAVEDLEDIIEDIKEEEGTSEVEDNMFRDGHMAAQRLLQHASCANKRAIHSSIATTITAQLTCILCKTKGHIKKDCPNC